MNNRKLKQIATYGCIGAVGGVAYTIVNSYARMKFNVGELNPRTEALIDNTEMFNLFVRLQEYRDISEKHFRRAVDLSDRLMFLHQQLLKQEIQPTHEDRVRAFVYFKETKKNLEALVRRAKDTKSTKVPVYVHELYKKIHACLESTWGSVMRMTNEI